MKHYIKNVMWKFKDSTEIYPQLKDKKIKVVCPEDIFNNFRFCSMEKLEKDLLSFG